MGGGIAVSQDIGHDVAGASPAGSRPRRATRSSAYFGTSDGRFIIVLHAAGLPLLARGVRAPRHPELVDDPRFDTHEQLFGERGRRRRADRRRGLAAERCRMKERLAGRRASGRRCRTPSRSPTTRWSIANGYLQELETPTATRSSSVTTPVQFDEAPSHAGRSPEFNEHGDEILSRARPRLGHHHRPQGQGRRRMTSASTVRTVRGSTVASPSSPAARGTGRGDGRAVRRARAPTVYLTDVDDVERARSRGQGGRRHLPPSRRRRSRVVGALVVQRVSTTHGRIDILVNNAGIIAVARMAETSFEPWERGRRREPDRRVPRHEGRRAGDDRAGERVRSSTSRRSADSADPARASRTAPPSGRCGG